MQTLSPLSAYAALAIVSAVEPPWDIRAVKRQFPVPPREQPIPVVGRETGRNQPCPCGSKKKYKRCCMRKQP